MSSSSVSFRISRHTQDLAETVHALSQRLVTMEQRLEALEGHLQVLRQQPRQEAEEEVASLAPIEANIERLLQDCRQLLADQPCGFNALTAFPDAAEGAEAPGLEQAVEEPDAVDGSVEAADRPGNGDRYEDDLEAAQAA